MVREEWRLEDEVIHLTASPAERDAKMGSLRLRRILIPHDTKLITLLAGDDVEGAVGIEVEGLHEVIPQAFRPTERSLLPGGTALLLQLHDALQRAWRSSR